MDRVNNNEKDKGKEKLENILKIMNETAETIRKETREGKMSPERFHELVEIQNEKILKL